ncbi:MAG: hypothetical protein PVSMB4_17400 [Ktedonobacterales bacterium]
MELRHKLLHLRAVAGRHRGLQRPLTQGEVVAAMRQAQGTSVSQAYLSQLERGTRTHLSNKSREALATFYGVHPGYLVTDPPDFAPYPAPAAHGETSVQAGPHTGGAWVAWAVPGLHALLHDPSAHALLSRLGDHPDPRRVLQLLEHLLALSREQLDELSRSFALEVAEVE